MNTDKIVVWFSCGAASAVAAHETLRRFPDSDVRIVNSPIAEEDADNRRFADDVGQWLGREIETATNSKYPSASAVEVWEKRKFMSSPYGAPCTVELKKEARRQWETANPGYTNVLGFTADEVDRYERFRMSETDNIIPVLIDAGLTKVDCYMRLTDAGITLPKMYRLGFPNANCKMCVKATSPSYYNAMRKHFPEDFAARAEQSRRLGARLVRVNNQRIFLDELDPAAEGQPMKNMQSECGLFCEEAG